MKKALLLTLVATLAAALWLTIDYASSCQRVPTKSCFNNLAIDPSREWNDYSFVVLSHIRSAPEKPTPNQNLRKNVQNMFEGKPDFVISLGDIFYNISDARVNEITSWVTQNIPVPFFNAPGNHDTQIGGDPLPDGSMTRIEHDLERYEQAFGNPNYEFTLGSELFIFLDHGRTPFPTPENFARLTKILKRAADDDAIKNVFLMTHLVIWSYNNPELEPVYRYRHPVRPPEDYRFFLDELKPLLEPLTRNKRVFLLAGDIGGGGKYLQTFYHQDEDFTYIATGMGGNKRDSFITVSVKDGEVSFLNTNFTSGEESSLDNFGLDYWVSFYRDNPKLAAAADQIDRAE